MRQCQENEQILAQLAELVDALVSGTSVLLDVKVRVLYWAPGEIQIKLKALKINILSAFCFPLESKKHKKSHSKRDFTETTILL